MKRRELFSSLASSFTKKEKQEKIIRPPYYKDEEVFLTNCIECNDKKCSTVCEENIILILEDKTPAISFENSGCTYCDECANACEHGVLELENKKNIDVKIEIDILSCLSWNKTMCFSCKDPCLDEAIDFLAMFRPEINSNCTSCGYCIKYCPADAIKIV
ncbi:ferredoxin-type protein NapF [Arcobacter sp. YIC-310]|uniref:ferredoxin-type protein NapF n=1 Tax=Arcobacter sp. YIC-310 TaxID=3376632 RepID=UPI003C139854